MGILLLGSMPAAAAPGCPPFLIASGYADLCSASAWMTYEHQNNHLNQLVRRKHQKVEGGQPGHASRMKIRLHHPGRK